MNVVWAVFAVDYIGRMVCAPDRGWWFVRHLADLAVVALSLAGGIELAHGIAFGHEDGLAMPQLCAMGVLGRGAG